MYERVKYFMLKKLQKRLLTLVLILTMAAFTCSCGKEESEKPKEKRSDVLSIQMREPQSLNPLAADNRSIRDGLSLCYEPLFEIGEDMKTEGVLAENIKVSDDCLSVVVTLKDSVLWHDGVSFTSSDVVHTINMLKENPSWEYYGCVKNIESVQAIDPLSLQITLKRSYGQIAHSLTFPIVAAHNNDVDENIIGTGAYCFEKYNPATMIELKSFDRWHGGEAKIAKINITVIRDAQTATTSFNTGLIDAITSETFDSENSIPREKTLITPYPHTQYEYLVFNHNKKPFDSQIVRSAISSAIDREAIVKECYAQNAVITNLPIHPMAQGTEASSNASGYSLANTNELLFMEGFVKDEKSGVLRDKNSKELTFRLLVNSENQSRIKSANLISRQLFAAGINVVVKEADFDEYEALIKRGEFDAYLGGTRLLNLYDFEFLLSKDGALNNYGYFGEQMEAVLKAISSAPSDESRVSALLNFEEVFLREQPICGIAFKNENLMTEENLSGSIEPGLNNPYRSISRWEFN